MEEIEALQERISRLESALRGMAKAIPCSTVRCTAGLDEETLRNIDSTYQRGERLPRITCANCDARKAVFDEIGECP